MPPKPETNPPPSGPPCMRRGLWGPELTEPPPLPPPWCFHTVLVSGAPWGSVPGL